MALDVTLLRDAHFLAGDHGTVKQIYVVNVLLLRNCQTMFDLSNCLSLFARMFEKTLERA